MAKSVRIVTDSASDLSPEVAKNAEIEVVPLKVRFGDEEFIDGVELTNDAFWKRMATTSTLPSTAAPSPGNFEEVFRKAAAEGCEAVVCICLSSKLSATYQAAVAAANAVQDTIPVHVIDSLACAIQQGTLVLEAANTDGGPEEIIKAVTALQGRMHLFAALGTLENLKKGGRIGAAGAFFGSLLSIKPIVTLRDGEVQAESKQRTRSRAIEYLAQLVIKRAPVDHVVVAHSNAPDLEEFLTLLEPAVNREQITIAQIGPVVGTHTGPGLIAVSFASA